MSSDPDSTPSSSFLMELVGRGGSEEMVGVGAMLSFSCCLCPAGELKPCFSVSATEQQQNQYSKHCKRNTPSADVHGIFPNHYFFFLFGLILILSSPLLSLPPPRVLLVLLCFSLCFGFVLSVSLCCCGPGHSLTGFGVGVLSRAVVGCGDRSLPELPLVPSSLYSSVCPIQLVLLALGRLVWKKRVASSIRSPTSRKLRMDFRTPKKKGFSEESLGGPFGLLTCVLAPLQLAGLLG